MADFNPSIRPTSDPSYLGLSKPISQPPANQALEAAFKGLGNVFESGVKGLDYLVKSNIDDQVYSTVDKERGQFTEALEQVTGVTGQTQTQKPMNVMSYDAEDNPNIPANLKELPKNLDVLKAARDAGMPETHYLGQLHSAAKALRTQYPGYRDYIDTKFREVTGVDTANAYYKSLLDMHKKNATDSRGLLNKTLNDIQNNIHKHPMMPQMYDYVRSTGDITAGNKMLHMINAREHELKIKDLERKEKKENRTFNQEDEQLEAGSEVAKDVAINFETEALSTGMNTPQKMIQFLSDAAAGKIQVKDEQVRDAGEAIVAQKEMYIRRKMAEWSKSGRVKDLGGPAKAREILEKGTAVYDDAAKWIFNKDWGQAFSVANRVKARLSDEQMGLLDSPVGDHIARMSAVDALAPNFVKSLTRPIVSGDVPTKLRNYVEDSKYKLMAPDLRKEGVSFKGQIDHAKNKNIAKTGAPAKVYEDIISTIDYIANPKASPALKESLAAKAFTPANYGMVAEFNEEQRIGTFMRFTSSAVNQEMAKLVAQKPQWALSHLDWVQKTFANDIFRSEINTLKDIVKDPTMKIAWDPDNNQFVLNSTIPLSNQRRSQSPYFETIQRSVNRLNMGLLRLSEVAKAYNRDVPAFLLETMDREKVQNIPGIPQDLMNALIQSRKAQTAPKFNPTRGQYE